MNALRLIRIALPQPLAGLLAAGFLLASGCAGAPQHDPAAIANTYLEAERFAEAAREIDIAVRQEPRQAELRLQAADIHAAAGHLNRAIEHLELAMNLAPDNADVAIRLGQLEQQRGNPTDAYVAFRRAMNLSPDDVRAVSGLALSAEALGFDEEAAEAYQRWSELEGSPPPAAADQLDPL